MRSEACDFKEDTALRVRFSNERKDVLLRWRRGQ